MDAFIHIQVLLFQDDEECMDEEQCSHGCEELPGSFQCTCLPGYGLVDRTTCKREGKVQKLQVCKICCVKMTAENT